MTEDDGDVEATLRFKKDDGDVEATLGFKKDDGDVEATLGFQTIPGVFSRQERETEHS